MSEEQARQLAGTIKMLERRLASIMEIENTVASTHTIMQNTSADVRAIRDNPSSEVMMSIGNIVRVPVTIPQPHKMVLNIGSAVAVEKDPSSVLNYLEIRIKELETSINGIAAEKMNVMTQLERAKEQMQNILQATAVQAQDKNV